MTILTRYIIKEHSGPFLFSLSVIMFVFVTKFIVQYIGKIFGKGLSVSTIFEFIYLNLAWMLALAVPMAVLIATLMAFGRLSSDNEITILKSSGINLFQILRPALLASLVLTILMVIYNDRVLPDFNHRARLLFQSISRKKPTLEMQEGLYLTMGKYTILVDEIEESLESTISEKGDILAPSFGTRSADKLKNITIADYSSSQYIKNIVAKYGYLVFDKQREQLVFTLYDGEIHETNTLDYSEYRRITFSKNNFYIPAPDIVFKLHQDSYRGDREMDIEAMLKEVRIKKEAILKQKEEIRKNLSRYFLHPDSIASWLTKYDKTEESNLAAINRAAYSKALRKTQSISQQLLANKSNIDHFEKQINKYMVEVHKKFSIPFACIVFILVGAPLGIRARKGSFGVGFSFSVGFFLIYWVCLIGGEELADRQYLTPFLAMWFPNIVVGITGLYMVYRTLKETSFIYWEKAPKILQFLLRVKRGKKG